MYTKAFMSWHELTDKKIVFLGDKEIGEALKRAGIIKEIIEDAEEKMKKGDGMFLEDTKVVLCFCENREKILRLLRMKFNHADVPFLYLSVLREDPLEEELKNFENIAQKILIPFTLQNLVEIIRESSPPTKEEIEKFNQKSFREWARTKLHPLRVTPEVSSILDCSSNVEDFLKKLENSNIDKGTIERIRKTLINKKE